MNFNKRFLEDAQRAIRHKERYKTMVENIAVFIDEHCECRKDIMGDHVVEDIMWSDDLPETAKEAAPGEYINGDEDFFDMFISTGSSEEGRKYLVLVVTPEPFI